MIREDLIVERVAGMLVNDDLQTNVDRQKIGRKLESYQ